MKYKSLLKGFTLVEILLVIAVSSILFASGISLLNPTFQLNRGNDARRKADLLKIQSGLEQYYADAGDYPGSVGWCSQISDPSRQEAKAALQNYLKKIPQDPKYAGTTKDYYYWHYEVGQYRLYSVLDNTNDPAVSAQVLTNDPTSINCANKDIAYNYLGDSSAPLGPTSTITLTPTNTPTITLTPTVTPTPTPIQYTVTTGHSTSSSSYADNYSYLLARKTMRVNLLGFYGGGAGMTYRIYNSDSGGAIGTLIASGTLSSTADAGGYYTSAVSPAVTLTQGNYYYFYLNRTSGSIYYNSITTTLNADVSLLKYKFGTGSLTSGTLGLKFVYDLVPATSILTPCFSSAPTGLTSQSTTGWKNTSINNMNIDIPLTEFGFYGSGGSGAQFELHQTSTSRTLPGTILYSGTLSTTADANGYYTVPIPSIILSRANYYVFRVNVASGTSYYLSSSFPTTTDYECRYQSTGTSSVISTGSYAIQLKY